MNDTDRKTLDYATPQRRQRPAMSVPPSAIIITALATAAIVSYYHNNTKLAGMLGALLAFAVLTKALTAGLRRW